MSSRETDLHSASAAEIYALQFPYPRSIRMRRDLKHFDRWLRATFEVTIDTPLPLSFIYKVFFLSHIALYPNTMARDRFLSDDLERDLQHSGLLDGDVLSCQQVAARILPVIRWQHYRFNVDTHELMRELIPCYRRLCEMTRSHELTYKSALQSEMILKVFRFHPLPGPQPERDLVVLLMTWVVGCSPNELIQLSFDNIDAEGPVDWVYLRPNAEGVPVKLDHMTALSILSLVHANSDLKSDETSPLLVCRDGLAWIPLTEGEIEVILERHYRFAGALYGFDQYASPIGRSTPDLLPQEEELYTEALRTVTNRIFARRRRSRPEANEEPDHDWDATVRSRARPLRSAEQETGGAYEDEQVDWDAAITKPKQSSRFKR